MATDHQPTQPFGLATGMMFPASPHMVDASAPGTPPDQPGLSFLHEASWAEDGGAPDDAIGGMQGDDGTASDGSSIDADVAAALKDVTPSTTRGSPEAMATRDRSLRAWPRGSLVAAEAFEKPVETGTTKTVEEVPPDPEKKSLEVVVSQDPSQQRPLSGCPRRSPAAGRAFEEPVVAATAKDLEEVHPGSEKWSTVAAISPPPTAAKASKSEDVAAAAMGAMVPQGRCKSSPSHCQD